MPLCLTSHHPINQHITRGLAPPPRDLHNPPVSFSRAFRFFAISFLCYIRLTSSPTHTFPKTAQPKTLPGVLSARVLRSNKRNSAPIRTTHQYRSQRCPIPSVAVILVFALSLRDLPIQSSTITRTIRVLTTPLLPEAVHGFLVVSVNLVRQSFRVHHRTTSAFLNSSIPSCSPCIHTDLFQYVRKVSINANRPPPSSLLYVRTRVILPQQPNQREPRPRRVGGDK